MSTKKLIKRPDNPPVKTYNIPTLQPIVSTADNTYYAIQPTSQEIITAADAYKKEQLQRAIEEQAKRQPVLRADTRSQQQRQADYNTAVMQETKQKANEQAAIFGRALGSNHDMTIDEVNENTLNTANLMGYMVAPYLMTTLESGYYLGTNRPKEAAVNAGVGFGLPILSKPVAQLPNKVFNFSKALALSGELNKGINKTKFTNKEPYLNVGWAPKQDINVYHASNEPLTIESLRFPDYNNWAVSKGAPADVIYLAEGDKPVSGFLTQRPYLQQWEVSLNKPMVQVGEIPTETKNLTRGKLLKQAQSQGADAMVFDGIADNQMKNQRIVADFTKENLNNRVSSIRLNKEPIPTLDQAMQEAAKGGVKLVGNAANAVKDIAGRNKTGQILASLNEEFGNRPIALTIPKILRQAKSDLNAMNLYHDLNVAEYNAAMNSNIESIPFRTNIGQARVMPKEDFIDLVKSMKTNTPNNNTNNVGGLYSPNDDMLYIPNITHPSNVYHEYLHQGRYGVTNPEITRWRINQLVDKKTLESMKPEDRKYFMSEMEFPVHLRQQGEKYGIKVGEPYPGEETFDKLIEEKGIGGAAYYVKRNTPEQKELFWKALNGTLFGSIPIGVGIGVSQSQSN